MHFTLPNNFVHDNFEKVGTFLYYIPYLYYINSLLYGTLCVLYKQIILIVLNSKLG